MGAVKYLAEFAGLNLDEIGFSPYAEREQRKRRQRSDILDLAAGYFADQMWSDAGKDALDYARSRSFTDDVLRMAGWGFSDGSTGLRDYLEQAGADMIIARKTGLIRKDGRDFTANRDGDVASPFGWLVYTHRPYANARRKKCEQCETETWHYENRCLQHELYTVLLNGVTYFSARAIVPAGKDKSRNLPGDRKLYKAEVPTVRAVILCEGPADAESYRLLGFTAWALCGLGHLPESDLRQLKKRPAVYLALDNDEAGLKNQAKLAQELGPLTLLMPPLEGVKDANDFLQRSGDAQIISDQLENSQVFLSKLIEDADHSSGHDLLDIVEQIIEMLKQLADGLRPFYSRATEAALNMTPQELRGLLRDETQVEVSQVQEPEDPLQLRLLNEALAEGRVLLPKSYGKPYLVEQGISEWGKVVYGIGYGRKAPDVEPAVHKFARQQTNIVQRDGTWLWAGSIVYADPPVNPDVISICYIPDVPENVRPFQIAKRKTSWGQGIQPLGLWRVTPKVKTLIVMPDVFDMLILAQALHKRGQSDAIAVCTNDQPTSTMLTWFTAHPEYEYLLIPDPADIRDKWRDALSASIRKGKGRFRTEKTPDELSPQNAVLAGWWPKGI